jgi:hypothetical protein
MGKLRHLNAKVPCACELTQLFYVFFKQVRDGHKCYLGFVTKCRIKTCILRIKLTSALLGRWLDGKKCDLCNYNPYEETQAYI